MLLLFTRPAAVAFSVAFLGKSHANWKSGSHPKWSRSAANVQIIAVEAPTSLHNLHNPVLLDLCLFGRSGKGQISSAAAVFVTPHLAAGQQP